MRESLRRLRESGDTTTFEGMDPDGPLGPFVTPDRLVSSVIEGEGFIDQKMSAMKAHATQITLDGPFFALSNNNGNEIWGSEAYRLVKGAHAPGPDGLEHDLFAGL
jgi:N-acetyl-1-D-myo-inositol-2-amino-2-deoxy-alpha-D-glucopyranoside deacetylase